MEQMLSTAEYQGNDIIRKFGKIQDKHLSRQFTYLLDGNKTSNYNLRFNNRNHSATLAVFYNIPMTLTAVILDSFSIRVLKTGQPKAVRSQLHDFYSHFKAMM